MQISPFTKYGLIFATIPMVSTYVLGHIFKAEFLPDLESMAFPIVEYIFPFAGLSFVIALACWVIFMRKSPSLTKGIFAGLITVFMSYPIIGFAIGFIHPDLTSRISSAIMASISLALIGNILTFWLTYPLGAICGGLIATRFKNSLEPKQMTEFD